MRDAVQTVPLELDHFRHERLANGKGFFVCGDFQADFLYQFLRVLTYALSFIFGLLLAVFILIVRDDLVSASQFKSL